MAHVSINKRIQVANASWNKIVRQEDTVSNVSVTDCWMKETATSLNYPAMSYVHDDFRCLQIPNHVPLIYWDNETIPFYCGVYSYLGR